ncbi:MAG: insulinase family protein, partial [Nitrospinae bacterium]|nr:insulinase family protein [Nitrospinota bacterium]
LAYAVYSFIDTYSDGGAMGIYAGVSPNELTKVLALIAKELRSIAEDGVEAEELTRTKDQLKSQMTLALEDSTNRMSRLAKQVITFGRHWTIEESMGFIDAVSLEEIQALAEEIFVPSKYCLAAIGPVSQETLESLWPLE